MIKIQTLNRLLLSNKWSKRIKTKKKSIIKDQSKILGILRNISKLKDGNDK